jgi:phospholipase/carboxylesterase
MRVMSHFFDRGVTRREFGLSVGSGLISVALGEACVVSTQSPAAREGRLTARPADRAGASLTSGRLGLEASGRDGVIQLPSVRTDGKLPLLVFLHGATQNGAGMLRRIGPAADQAGVALLAPDSRDTTWDAVTGRFGEDVSFLDRALEHVFARLAIDPARVAIGGFSDGASYALSLGLANGDLFTRVVACSPGFVIPVRTNGRPRFFVSHGISDQILPIDQCSRVIVPQLRSRGYDVTFREFEGRHELPADTVTEALRWIAAA